MELGSLIKDAAKNVGIIAVSALEAAKDTAEASQKKKLLKKPVEQEDEVEQKVFPCYLRASHEFKQREGFVDFKDWIEYRIYDKNNKLRYFAKSAKNNSEHTFFNISAVTVWECKGLLKKEVAYGKEKGRTKRFNTSLTSGSGEIVFPPRKEKHMCEIPFKGWKVFSGGRKNPIRVIDKNGECVCEFSGKFGILNNNLEIHYDFEEDAPLLILIAALYDAYKWEM